MLDKLRNKCNELYSLDQEKYELIKNILANDNCFFEIEQEVAYSILKDLNIPEEDIKKVYLSLIKKEEFK